MSDVAGAIYLVHSNKQLLEMVETRYDSEDLLQSLLADYPHLLAGDQIYPSDPRRWLLVSREVSLPSNDNLIGQWSVDHLFLDQEGVPTIVEVKRSSDTRIRREVVGQMLEYAANAVAYWPIDKLRDQFDARCQAQELVADDEITKLLGPGGEAGDFWKRVQTNLQAGRVRLIFVADQVPPELQRIVEFLGTQLKTAEVFAIEVKQFVGHDQRALVPRLVAGSVQRRDVDGGGKRQWDEPSFVEELMKRRGTADVEVFRQILVWAKRHSLPPWWGSGAHDGSYFPSLRPGGETYWLFAVWTYGLIQLQFGMMKTKPPFDDEVKREELRQKLNAVEGIDIATDKLAKFPSIPLSTLKDQAVLGQFLKVFEWVIEETLRSREVVGDVAEQAVQAH